MQPIGNRMELYFRRSGLRVSSPRPSVQPRQCRQHLCDLRTRLPLVQRNQPTGPQYGVPKDTYEGRLRLRLRIDSLTRNLMELPHKDSRWEVMS